MALTRMMARKNPHQRFIASAHGHGGFPLGLGVPWGFECFFERSFRSGKDLFSGLTPSTPLEVYICKLRLSLHRVAEVRPGRNTVATSNSAYLPVCDFS